MYKSFDRAGLAQLVEQLICNHQVVSSSPTTGTIKSPPVWVVFLLRKKRDEQFMFTLTSIEIGLFNLSKNL